MIGLEYIIAPVLGGVIGYITNDIAIRMLFRPHTAKYICGVHIPLPQESSLRKRDGLQRL